MNTSDIYSKIIIENIIKEYLQQGTVPSIEQIELDFNAYIEDQDLNSSNFTAEEWTVERKEVSSASKFNGMTDEMKQDITVLYKSLLSNGERSSKLLQKWQAKTYQLENRIKNLEAKVGRLLVREADTSGYFQVVGDKFTNTDLIDLDRSAGLLIDLNENIIGINKKGKTVPDKLFLNEIRTEQVKFNLITRNNIVGSSLIDNTQFKYAFVDSDLYWKSQVTSKVKQSVLVELVLNLDTAADINAISIDLHSSQSNATTVITPLFSLDGINFTRIPSANEVGEGVDKVFFQFEMSSVKVIKLLMEKNSHDYIDGENFIYEFGAHDISFYTRSFDKDTSAYLIGKPLSVTLPTGSLHKFNKVLLESCDGIPEKTAINYFVSVAKVLDSQPYWLVHSGYSSLIEDEDGEDQRVWLPITSFDKEDNVIPKVLDLVSLSSNTVSGINLSFDPDDAQVSPASDYLLLNTDGENVITSNETSTANRYIFGTGNQFALDIQLDKDLPISREELKLWRNVGSRGIESSDTNKMVRGIQAGWEFETPYYKTTILISGSQGMNINVGKNPIEIDGTYYTDAIDSSVLSPGIHKIKVHQNFWNAVIPGINTLEELKEKDSLYPFNQKLLIEGYSYGTSYPTSQEKIYQGVDRFAGYFCNLISIFDLNHNTSSKNLDVFAIDTDLEESVTGLSDLIIINCDTSRSDFVNESFVLEFVLTEQLFSYIALKATLATEDENLSPLLDEYKIKLGL